MSHNYETLLNEYFNSNNKNPKEHADDIWEYAGFRRAGTVGDKKASEIISKKFKIVGADKIMFGSDVPFHHSSLMLTRIKTMRLSKIDEDKILSGTAKKAFKLKLNE